MTKEMRCPVTAYIGLGANLGARRHNLLRAWQRVGGHPRIRVEALSSPYETAPVDMASPHWFVNAVGRLKTDLAPEALLAALLAVEAQMGRERTASRDRIIDLDLLFYDELIKNEAGCTVPHPEIAGRAFVLVPLAEIAPAFRHPGTGRTAAEMLAVLPPAAQVVRKTIWEEEGHAPT